MSTLVLEWAGLLAFFFTLRTLGIAPLLGALGTLALFFNPVLFVLSHSFMTDVPFVSVMNLATLYYVRWAQRRKSLDLGLGSFFATMSFLTRQIGAALSLVPLVYLLLSRMLGRERRALPWHQILILLLPFLGVGLTLWWIKEVHGETRVYLEQVNNLRYIGAMSGWLYLKEMVHPLVHLGLVLWPLAWGTLGSPSKRSLVLAAGFVTLVTGLYLWQVGEIPNPLGVVLSLEEPGLSRSLIAGEVASRQIPIWIRWALLSLSLISAIAIVAALWEGLRRWSHWVSGPGTLMLISSLMQFLLIEALWLYYDRYGSIPCFLEGVYPDWFWIRCR